MSEIKVLNNWFTKFESFNPKMIVNPANGVLGAGSGEWSGVRFTSLPITIQSIYINHLDDFSNWKIFDNEFIPYNTNFDNIVDLSSIINMMNNETKLIEMGSTILNDNEYTLVFELNIIKYTDSSGWNSVYLRPITKVIDSNNIVKSYFNDTESNDTISLSPYKNNISNLFFGIDMSYDSINKYLGFSTHIEYNDDFEVTKNFKTCNLSGFGGLNFDSGGDRGYYHGLPSSLLYQRQFIRGGINYLRNIDIYDETYKPVNSAFLSNRVGTLSYNGIEFAYPYIRVKARTNLLFTHVVTASWSADNRPVVYKVINYKCLGGDLNEYTLRVDGLKTYFQYHGITTSSPVCLRHTNSANWNKWIQDTVPYDGTYSYMKLTGTAVTYLVCLVVNGNAYAMTKNHFNAFCGSLMARDDQEKIINQISNVFVVPYTSSNDCYNPATEITFTDSSFTATADYWMPDYGNIQGQLQTEALKPIQDQSYVYDSNAKIHFPCYGDVNAPYDFIINLSQSPQQVKYRISFIDGTCSVSTYPFIFWSPAVGLPQKSIPFDSSKVSLYNINKNQQAGIGNIITSALGGAVAGAVAGVKAGGVGAVAGAIVGAVGSGGVALMNNNTTADAQRDIVANSQGIHSVASTGGSSMADPNISISFLIPNLATNYPDYYKVVGYPVQKPLKDCVTSSGDVIWLNFNIPELKDNREIIEDLYKASQEGIFWNA